MKVFLHKGINLRNETFGSIILVPFELERPDVPQFFKLNRVGTTILENCKIPISVRNLTEKVLIKYPRIDKNMIESFINELSQIGILKVVDNNSFPRFDRYNFTKVNLKFTPKLSAPLSAFIEITDKCILQCIHCYTRAKIKKEKNFEDRSQWVFQLIDGLTKLGVMTVGFGGGEPTLDKNLPEYLSRCASTKIKTAISTSGVFITNKNAIKLKNAGLGIAQISLDGPPTVHDYIRGNGVYNKAINALKIFSKIGIETRVAMTVSSINWNLIEKTANLAFKNGADRFVVFRYMPSGPNGEKLSLSINELKKVSRKLVLLEKKHSETVIGFEPLCFYPHLVNESYSVLGPCNAGNDVLNICADGTVTPCPHMRNYHLGKYPKDSLEKIWQKAAEFGKEIISKSPLDCIGCKFINKCGGGCNYNLTNDGIRRKDVMCWSKQIN